MAFYTDFAGHYEQIFPYRAPTFAFLDRWLPAQGQILDIGCGTGHYAGALAATDRDCLGIDIDPGMIAAAEAAHPTVRFRLLGMEEIGLLMRNGFAGITCIGNVLPHLALEQLPRFVAAVRNRLRPGGIWIFQTVNFDRLLDRSSYRFPDIVLRRDRLKFTRRYEDITADSLRFVTRLLQFTTDEFLAENAVERFSGEVVLHPRTREQYLTLHREAGFERLGHFADFQEREFDAAASGGSVYVFRRD